MEQLVLTNGQRLIMQFLLAFICLGLAPLFILALFLGGCVLIWILFILLASYGVWKKLWGLVIGAAALSILFLTPRLFDYLAKIISLPLFSIIKVLNVKIGGPGVFITIPALSTFLVSAVICLVSYFFINAKFSPKVLTDFEKKLARLVLCLSSIFLLSIAAVLIYIFFNKNAGIIFESLFLISMLCGLISTIAGIIFICHWLNRERV